jgi:hypothetical protein
MKLGITNHFHCAKDGCKIVIHYKRPKYGVVHINFVKCETHNVKICRCGFEWHWHGEENTCKLYPKGVQERVNT